MDGADWLLDDGAEEFNTLPGGAGMAGDEGDWFSAPTFRGLPSFGGVEVEAALPEGFSAAVPGLVKAPAGAMADFLPADMSLGARSGAPLPPLAMLTSSTAFTVPVPAGADAGDFGAQVMDCVHHALATLGATSNDEGNPLAVVANSYDFKTYATVTYEVAVMRAAAESSAPSTSAITPPTHLVVDVTRRSGDAFLFGGLYNRLRTSVMAGLERPAGLPISDADILGGVTRGAGVESEAPLGVSSLGLPLAVPTMSALCALPDDGAAFDGEGVECGLPSFDVLGDVTRGTSLPEAPSAPSLRGVEAVTGAIGAGKDLPAPPALSRAVSADASDAVGALMEAVGDAEAADVAAMAAQKLCEVVVTDTAFGASPPAPASTTAALMGTPAHLESFASALRALAAAPFPDMYMPLTVAAAAALAGCTTTEATAQGVAAVRAALAAASATSFGRSAAVPAHVRTAMTSVLA